MMHAQCISEILMKTYRKYEVDKLITSQEKRTQFLYPLLGGS